MNTRIKGNRNEARSAKYLEKLGYYTVLSRRSKGVFDVWAMYIDNNALSIPFRLVQVETGTTSSSKIKVLQSMARMAPNCCQIEHHLWIKGKREPKITIITGY